MGNGLSRGNVFFIGALKILTGKPQFHSGVALVPAWVGWIELLFGTLALFFSIRALWRNRQNSKLECTENATPDEKVAHAATESDAMPPREHGEPPEIPKKDA